MGAMGALAGCPCRLALFAAVAAFAMLDLSSTAFAESTDRNDASRSPVTLQLTSSDRIGYNGLIVKKVNDSFTLSCALVDSDNITLPVENINFNIAFSRQNSNRTHIWAEGNMLHLSVESLQLSDAGQYTCFALNYSGIVSNTYVAVKLPNSIGGVPFCGAMMFSCGEEFPDRDGAKCVPYSFLCDGRQDCPSARDESTETCGTSDPCLNKLQCNDGRCIPKQWCCNKGQKECVPHPCCAEQPHEDILKPRTGGGYRKNPNDEYVIQATLYKACACLLLIIVTISIFISAICRVRLKRIANSQGHLPMDYNVEVPSPDLSDGHPSNFSIPATQECQYSLVRYTDTDSNYDVMNQSCPPSYSEYIAQTNQFHRPSSRNMSLSQTSHSLANTDDNRTRSNTAELEREDSNSNHNSPARRPNDFGMGVIANAIFNSRYRPVPQQNFEITSIDYATDSDSSCRSPAHRVINNPLSLGTVEFNSHFYGERVGGSPEINILRGLSDNRRLRHANALDRILDRFGLNAPYNVNVNRDNRTTLECQSFLSPTGSDSQNPNRPRVLSTIWTRLKDRFSRNQTTTRSNHRDGRCSNNNNLPNNSSNFGRHRRRPDTPDVPEPTFSDRLPHALTCFLSEDRRLDLCGDSFGELNFHRGLIFSRDLRLVPAHSFPPPYSQFAPDPPPPYVSRENLVASRANVNLESDQNGNVVSNSSNANENDTILTNIDVSTNTNSNNSAQNESSSFVAFDICDDNGNIEQAMSNSSDLNVVDVNMSDTSCSDCTHKSCHVHSQERLMKQSSNELKIVESGEPSTSLCLERNIDGSDVKLCALNNHNSALAKNLLQKRVNSCGDELNGNVMYENNTNLNYRIVESGTNENIKNVLDQNNPSVHCEDFQINFEPSNLEASRMTDECGLVFPPNNLEFIDSDISEDRSRVDL